MCLKAAPSVARKEGYSSMVGIIDMEAQFTVEDRAVAAFGPIRSKR